MTEPNVVPFTARCDGCGLDAEWTTAFRGGRNVTTVNCGGCEPAEFRGAQVVPLPPSPPPNVFPSARVWGQESTDDSTLRSA